MTRLLRIVAFSLGSLAPLISGCFASYITAPHQPYAPMLDHAGQVDVVVRGGGITTNNMSIAAQVAYAPIDHFEIAASLDGDFDRQPDNRTFHGGGGFALGTFTRTDVLRLEAFAGVNGGYAEGYGTQCVDNDEGCMTESFDLSGPYVQPFVQTAVGFEVPYFELAGGVRLEGQLTDVTAVGDEGTRQRVTHERLLFSPFLSVRVPVDVVRFEIMTGVPIVVSGDGGPLEGTYEPGAYWYFVGGIGVQLDTVERAPAEAPVPLPPAGYAAEPL